MSRGVRSQNAVFLDSASAWDLKLTHGILPLPPESGETNKNTQRNRGRGEEIRSTYLPLHRPLHAASVQSKSRTEIISGRTGTPGPVLSTEHSRGSTFTRLGGFVFCCWSANSLTALTFAATSRNREDNSSWSYFPSNDSKIGLQEARVGWFCTGPWDLRSDSLRAAQFASIR